MQNLWQVRKGQVIASSQAGTLLQLDVSLPLSHFYTLVEQVRELLGDRAISVGYGHMGDSNLHINISVPDANKLEEVKADVYPFAFEFLKNVKGSISAEHGVGAMNHEYLHYCKDETQIQYMRYLKNLFDPKGILNPYKFLPEIK